jgi:hypothetical protein
MLVTEDVEVSRGQKLAEWDPFTLPILTEIGGTIEQTDLLDGITQMERTDEVTGLSYKEVVEYKGSKSAELRPRLILRDAKGNVLKRENARTPSTSSRPHHRRRGERRRGECRRHHRPHAARVVEDTRHHGAVCRAWRSCSKRAGPRMPPSSATSTGGWSSARTTRPSAASS